MAKAKTDADAARFFNQFAIDFDTLYDGKRNALMRWLDNNFRSDIFIRFAKSFESLGDLNGREVLDIGCGSGPYVVEALHRGASKVTALDPAPSMLELVRKRISGNPNAHKVTFVEGLFPVVAVPPHDYAIVMGVMDYVEDPVTFLKALHNSVTTCAVVSFPSRHWFRTPIRQVRYWIRNCPLYFYSSRQITTLATNAGFKSVEVHKIKGAGMDYHVLLRK